MLIALIGMPASGKSTIARALARDFGFPLYDSDAEVERRFGLTVADVFAKCGEAVFRLAERDVIADIAGCRDRIGVLSTGGGAVEDEDTVHLLLQTCLV
ncbi:MAG: shikimate kinase, partial [Firmicutes bacterium]|nr:shikimate kinase [Bacillota bacterium]